MWNVWKCAPSHTLAFEAWCRNFGLKTYVPKFSVVQRRRRMRKAVEIVQPLLPGFVFVEEIEGSALVGHDLLHAKRWAWGDNFVVLPDSALNGLRSKEIEIAKGLAVPVFAVGEKVVVETGILAGRKATIVDTCDRTCTIYLADSGFKLVISPFLLARIEV